MRLSTFSPVTIDEEMRSLMQLASALKDRTLDRRGVANHVTVSVSYY